MSRPRRWAAMEVAALAALFLAALAITGCSRRPGVARYEVSGEVRYSGKAVAAGQVFFEPDGAAGNVGPQGRAEIVAGSFRTWPDQGAVAGPVIVRVSVYDGVAHRENPRGSSLGPAAEIRVSLPAAASTLDIDAVPPNR
jgi:hypothetical protein